MKFGLSQWNKKIPKKIEKLTLAIAGLLVTFAGYEYAQGSSLGFWLLVSAGILREVIAPLFGESEKTE